MTTIVPEHMGRCARFQHDRQKCSWAQSPLRAEARCARPFRSEKTLARADAIMGRPLAARNAAAWVEGAVLAPDGLNRDRFGEPVEPRARRRGVNGACVRGRFVLR